MRHELHHGRVVRCYADRPQNVFRMFEAALARAPEAVAVVDGDLRLSYADLGELTAAVAARLARAGVAAGDRVALLLDNRADVLVAMLAIARLGAICVPMNVRQRAPETAYALNQSGAVALVHEAALADQLPPPEETPSLKRLIAVDDDRRIWGEATAASVPDAVDVPEDAPFCILYTSGTTGQPKGAVLTHFGLVTNCIASRAQLRLDEREASILCVPASHVTGVLLILLLMVSVAGKTVMQRAFKARRFLELAAAEGMTYVTMVPTMYTLCLMDESFPDHDLSAWRVGGYGGAPMPEATAAKLARQAPNLQLVNIYGATETTSPAVMMPGEETLSRLSQVGRPLECYDLLIVDDQGREVPSGEQGEIWISGPGVIPHYWENPGATEANFVNGYWRSGDIGSMDDQKYITILDRKKDMINRGGYKIYSVEVEQALAAHTAVIEAAVIARPCPVLGERAEAYVVVGEAVVATDLLAHCAQRLSDYKVPDRVRIIAGSLPRNANGKLVKAIIRSWIDAPDQSPREIDAASRR